jgi:hypothetical protein
MGRLTAAVSTGVFVLWAGSAFAQAPNFTGAWVPDADKNPAPAAPGARGISIDITQDAKTITITPRSQGLPATYNLDGSDSKNAVSLGVEVVSTAKWNGSKLIVTTHTKQGDQATSYYIEGSELVIERGGANASQKTYYKRGR